MKVEICYLAYPELIDAAYNVGESVFTYFCHENTSFPL